MPVLYKPFQSALKDKKGNYLFYPRVQLVGNVNTAQIAQEIAEYSSLSPGDVENTLQNLVTVMKHHLQNSESVTLNGLGSFRIVMKSGGRGAMTAEEVSAAQATLYVRFASASTRNPNRSVATRSLVTGARCINATSLKLPTVDSAAGGGEEEPGGETV